MNEKSDSSRDMLSWQLKTLLGEIQQIELHETGNCPCILNAENPPERCLGKHLLNISTLSQETASMDSQNREWLRKLATEANQRHEQFREFICHTEELPELADWARNWRKHYIEPNYYTCKVKQPDKAKSVAASLETVKLTSGVKAIAGKLPTDGNTPVTGCSLREDSKN